jgi:hypothetical protein
MIYIIITTSINNKFGSQDTNHRKKRYIDSIEQLLQLVKNDIEIKPIIIENNGLRKTYLDMFNCDIVYSKNNKKKFKYKAANELLDIKEVINKYKIKNDDIIIKITGRYKLLNSNFINLVKDNSNTYDAFVKFYNVCNKTFMFDDCVLGLFAVKCKYLKDFNYKFIKSPECEFAIHIRNNIDKNKLMEINDLNLECCFADNLEILII